MLNPSNIENLNLFIPIILDAWGNINHYKILVPNNISKDGIPIEYKILNKNVLSSIDDIKSIR